MSYYGDINTWSAKMTVYMFAAICVLLLPLSASESLPFNVWSGEHLDDIIMKTDGSGFTDKHALLVIHDFSCSAEMAKLGISSIGLPATRTLAYLLHDYRVVQKHTWFKDNGDDLRFRFKAFKCPEVLFIPKGSTKNDPVVAWQWSLDPTAETFPFLTWVWAQLKVKVSIANFKGIAATLRVESVGAAGAGLAAYPQFTMAPGDTKEISIYESSLITTYTARRNLKEETFIGAWEIDGPTVVNLINSPGDNQVEEIALLDIQGRFEKEEQRQRQWVNSNSWRYLLNLKQPLFVHNLTKHGYHKRKIPDKWYRVLWQFYQGHKHTAQEESWPNMDSVINFDEVPNHMVHLSEQVKTLVSDGLKGLMEEWCDCELEMTSVFGIRVYHNGSILRNHVDRLETHVISAILQIDQKIRANWLLEVIDYHGERHQMLLRHGEMLMYESAKLIHGRPRPLNGDLYANVFLHYRPKTGWDDYSRQGEILYKGHLQESCLQLESPLTKKNAHGRHLFLTDSSVKDKL